jgi:hypothetical protein
MTCQYVADVVPLSTLQPYREQKMALKTGAIRRKYNFGLSAEAKEAISQTLDLRASKPKIGEIAVTRRDAGAAHEQTIDCSNQPAECGVRRGELGRSGVGHFGSLLERSGSCVAIWWQSRHTRCQLQFVLLHSSMMIFAMQHKWHDQFSK